LTTVLSSIAIASAKHMVSSTMAFSRALSPSNPSSATPHPHLCVWTGYPKRIRNGGSNALTVRDLPGSGLAASGLAVDANRQGDEHREDQPDPQAGLQDQPEERVAGRGDVRSAQREGPERIRPDRDGVVPRPHLEPARHAGEGNEGGARERDGEDPDEARCL